MVTIVLGAIAVAAAIAALAAWIGIYGAIEIARFFDELDRGGLGRGE